jgi:hypothetical protein
MRLLTISWLHPLPQWTRQHAQLRFRNRSSLH